jgi:hypothetical protein
LIKKTPCSFVSVFVIQIPECCFPCLSEHKYPYDWRSKEPTIFRATEQWFASVDGFRNAAMDAIRQVTWVPSQVFKFVFFLSWQIMFDPDPVIIFLDLLFD